MEKSKQKQQQQQTMNGNTRDIFLAINSDHCMEQKFIFILLTDKKIKFENMLQLQRHEE